MKLHNNPLSHQNTPADYILTMEIYNNLHCFLVECKQVTCKEGKGRLAFKRLKQLHDLLAFHERSVYHESYFCIGFYDNGWQKGEIYMVSVRYMERIIENFSKVSINRNEAKNYFSNYKAELKTGGVVDLWKTLKSLK